jgi:adenylosuccinate lyase
VHWGATTQDIMDTGTVLQVRDALDAMEGSLRDLLGAVAALAAKHRDTVMAGRSHGQQALPITFGFKAAVWAAEIGRHIDRIAAMRPRVLVGQFSGAVGTLAALGQDGDAVQRGLFEELGLGNPSITWHTARDAMAELACTIAIMAGTLGKMAHEVYALQKTETAELEEPFSPGKVGSSTMPHKRNPPACETIAALARAIRAIAPQAIEGVMAEHERDKIVLQSEREWTSRLFCMADAALAKSIFVMRGLTVRTENMTRNLDCLQGLLMSEPVMFALGARFGRQEAHEMVYEVCMAAFEAGRPLRAALLEHPKIGRELTPEEIDRALDPQTYTGLAGAFVDRVLAEVAPKLAPR